MFLSAYPFVWISVCLCLSIWLHVFMNMHFYLSIYIIYLFSHYISIIVPPSLSIYLSIYRFIYLSVCLSILLSINQSTFSIHFFIYQFIYIFNIYIYLSYIHKPAPLKFIIYVSFCLSVCLSTLNPIPRSKHSCLYLCSTLSYISPRSTETSENQIIKLYKCQ